MCPGFETTFPSSPALNASSFLCRCFVGGLLSWAGAGWCRWALGTREVPRGAAHPREGCEGGRPSPLVGTLESGVWMDPGGSQCGGSRGECPRETLLPKAPSWDALSLQRALPRWSVHLSKDSSSPHSSWEWWQWWEDTFGTMGNQGRATRSGWETKEGPLLLPHPCLGSPPWERSFHFAQVHAKQPLPCAGVIMQLWWRAIDDPCKALRRIFLGDHSALLSDTEFFIFYQPPALFFCFLLKHRSICISTGSSLCAAAFVPSLGIPLALSKSIPSSSNSAWNPSLQELTLLYIILLYCMQELFQCFTASKVNLKNPKPGVAFLSCCKISQDFPLQLLGGWSRGGSGSTPREQRQGRKEQPQVVPGEV